LRENACFRKTVLETYCPFTRISYPLRINLNGIAANPGIDLENYTLIDHHGRFVLLRKKN